MSHKLKPKKTLKKETFVTAAAISTIGLILTRVISVIYTIPFGYLIDDDSLTIHNYAYAMFNPFYELSLAGLPLAIARLISMYNARGEYKTSNRILRYAQMMMLVFGVILGVVFFAFARPYALYKLDESTKVVLDDLIRIMHIIAPSLVLLPFLSGMRGYLQGFKSVIGTTISQVVERLVFVIILLMTLYFGMYHFQLSASLAMSYAFIALPLASCAAIFVLLPFYKSVRREHQLLMSKEKQASKESTRFLLAQIVKTALPFVIAGLSSTLYGTIMTMFYEPFRIWSGASAVLARLEYNAIIFYTNKLVSIPLTFSLAIATSIISFVTSSYEGKRLAEMRRYVNRSYALIIFASLSSVLLMALLGKPLLTFFYGNNVVGYHDFYASVLAVDGFRGLFFALETISIAILQSIGQKNRAVFYTATGPVIKLLVMFPLVYFFGIYGEIVSIICGLAFVITLSIRKIMLVTNITLQEPLQTLKKTVLCFLPTFFLLLGLNAVVESLLPEIFWSRILAFIYLVFAGFFGVALFVVLADYNGLLSAVFGSQVRLKQLFKRYLKR